MFQKTKTKKERFKVLKGKRGKWRSFAKEGSGYVAGEEEFAVLSQHCCMGSYKYLMGQEWNALDTTWTFT